jgi:hypothetical protein
MNRSDGGQTFAPLVDGLQVVEGFDPDDVSFHDPHCVRLCPSNPDRLYQQNHCGIYRLDRPASTWARIGGHAGRRRRHRLPMVVHPRDAGLRLGLSHGRHQRVAAHQPGGKPAAYVTRNGGRSWQRLDAGLPPARPGGR